MNQLITKAQASEVSRAIVTSSVRESASHPGLVEFCDRFAGAMTRLVGSNVEEDGQIALLTCWLEGITPIEFSRKYHIIKGKPSMRSDATLAEFLRMGGEYQVIEKSSKKACIWLKMGEREGTFELTWETAKECRFPWKDWKNKDEGLKDNWATPLDQRNMLWARVVSDAVRTIEPRINAGSYSPEEVQDFDNRDPVTNVKSSVDDMRSAYEAMNNGHEDAEIVQEPEPEKDVAEVVAESDEADLDHDTNGSTTEQHVRIRELFVQVGVNEESIKRSLAKRGAESIPQLSRASADDLIASIESALAKKP